MRRVGQEAPLALTRTLEAREHGVEDPGQASDLVRRRRLGKSPPRVSRALDLRGRGGKPAERIECTTHKDGDGAGSQHSRDESGQEHEQVQARECLFQVVR